MLEIGSVIEGKYKILDVIGKGGMSTVYLALNERANKPWAVKEVRKKDYDSFQVDKKEIQMMRKLRHPHLPSIIDVIEGDGTLLIVMDYIEGRSLEDILSEYGRQPQEMVIGWAKQLCGVLSYLHSRKPAVIYRDMKPANVMLKPDGNVVLIDFGAAREYCPGNHGDTVSLGTRGYAAPEQYTETEQSDARTDIYGLGVMLFQLLTGESPYRLRPVREYVPELSAGLETVIQRCTKPRKEERYQSCEELLYALEHYQEMDSEYWAIQKRKLVCFLFPVCLTAAFILGAGVFRALESHARGSTYEAFLLAAQNSATKEEELNNYRKAIDLNPAGETAYLCLLKYGFLDDGILTAEESERMRGILISYGNGKQTNEQIFRENRRGYDIFSYEAGIAYFYKFEEESNKKNARGYFKTASESRTLEQNQVERAKRLYQISDYYARIGIVDEAGDASITYREYWEDLTSLSEGNLVVMDNERTALVIYEELVSQIISRTPEFMDAGVEKEEMLDQLEHVRDHLNSDFSGSPKDGIREEEIPDLQEDIETARRMVWSAYGQEGKYD